MSMGGSKTADISAMVVRWLRKIAGTWRVRTPRQLRLCETLNLGERRFLAVVQFEQQKFLVGGTGNSLSLLTELMVRDGIRSGGDCMESAASFKEEDTKPNPRWAMQS